ncbi:TPA: FAD-dependent oxidoreductase, partial [Candidatus Peregrinibacteria bacterium]|nr:FAD-dependent oxidoreductase [Candidatus Peregrinibacteria bacterium]
MNTFFADVVRNEIIAYDTNHITFSANLDLQFSAGQFFNLKLQNPDKTSKIQFILRGYSVASSPQKLPIFELCVKIVKYFEKNEHTGENIGEEKKGIGSGFLEKLKKGDRVEFLGPFGHFTKKNKAKKTVMLATGTGIAPMRAICEELSEEGFVTKTVLLYGVSNAKFACYSSFFQNLANLHKNFEYVLFISRETDEEIRKVEELKIVENIVSGRITKGVEDLSVE